MIFTSNYILTSNGELYHYGVKGMKWGHRKALKYEKQYTRKLGRAGRNLGAADYERSQGEAAYKRHASTAKALEKASKQYDKTGQHLKAEAARRAAEGIKARGANIKAQRDEAASYLEKRANKMQEKASSFATKKRVDMGKSKVDSILKSNRAKGYEYRKNAEEFGRELEIREKYGNNAYDAYEKFRGNG